MCNTNNLHFSQKVLEITFLTFSFLASSIVGCFDVGTKLDLSVMASFDFKDFDVKEREKQCVFLARQFGVKISLVYTNGKCKLVPDDMLSKIFMDQTKRLIHPQVRKCPLDDTKNKVLYAESKFARCNVETNIIVIPREN